MSKLKNLSFLPRAPFFYFDKNFSSVEVGFNQEDFPSKKTIKMCIKALEGLLDVSNEEVNEYHKERDESLFSYVSQPKQRKTEEGFIYLIKSNGIYKIGRAKSLDRIKKYSTENPCEIDIKVIHAVSDYKGVEKKILKKYEKNVVKGKEWLKLSEEQESEIISNIFDYE